MSRPIGISSVVGVLVSVLFVLTWSSGFVGVRLASESAPPETVLMWRSVVLTLALSPWLVRAVGRLRATDLRREALVGTLSQATYLGSVYWAIALGVSSGTTSLMDGLQPLVVAALAGPVLGAVVGARQWLGLALGLLGVLVVSYADLTSPASTAPWWAYAVPVVGMLGLVGATFVDRVHPRRAGPLEALALHCAVTALLSTAVAVALDGAAPVATVAFWSAVAWLAVLATLGGYGLYWVLLERRGVTRLNALLFAVPPVTVVWGAAWFGEPWGPLTVVGLLVALAGVRLASRPRSDARDRDRDRRAGQVTSPAGASAG